MQRLHPCNMLLRLPQRLSENIQEEASTTKKTLPSLAVKLKLKVQPYDRATEFGLVLVQHVHSVPPFFFSVTLYIDFPGRGTLCYLFPNTVLGHTETITRLIQQFLSKEFLSPLDTNSI